MEVVTGFKYMLVALVNHQILLLKYLTLMETLLGFIVLHQLLGELLARLLGVMLSLMQNSY